MITFYKSTFRKLVFPVVLIVVIFVAFDYLTFPETSIFSFVINCAVLSVVFIVMMYLFYLNPNEKEMVSGLIRKI